VKPLQGVREAGRKLANRHPNLFRGRRSARVNFTVGNTVRLFETGSDYFAALISHVDGAVREVILETYIFCDDAAGRPVAQALANAAQRGVNVRLITDGIGTARLPMFTELSAAGVEHRIYNPHLVGRLGYSRTHRKLAAIDGLVGYVGGINIVDDLMAGEHRLESPRWDFAVEVRGPTVGRIMAAFDTQWRRLGRGKWRATPAEQPQVVPGVPHGQAIPIVKLGALASGPGKVGFVARDNIHNRRSIEKAYLQAIGQARHEVLLANPYFIPGRKLRRALTGAAQRGVDVRLLIGRKEFPLLDSAVPFLYRALLKAGVRISEYDKTMLHGKVAVIDADWATVGSSNLDALSLLLNHEANLVIVQDPEMRRLREAIMEAFAEARPIDSATYASRPWTVRLLNWSAYAGYRLVMKLLTIGEYD
jgi:cardiolipin synthase